MRSVEARFLIMSDKYTDHSTFICFAKAVSHQRFSKRIISLWFDKLVDKNDYEETDKLALIDHLLQLSHSKKTKEMQNQ